MGTRHVKIPTIDTINKIFQMLIDLYSLLFLLMRGRDRLAVVDLFLRKELDMHQGRASIPSELISRTFHVADIRV